MALKTQNVFFFFLDQMKYFPSQTEKVHHRTKPRKNPQPVRAQTRTKQQRKGKRAKKNY
jgi:hypothetical protein